MTLRLPVRRFKILEQAVFWLFIFFFVFDYHFIDNNWGEAILNTLTELLTYAVVIYINLLLLIPLFLKKNYLVLYLLSIAGVIAGYVFLMRFTGWEQYLYEMEGWRNVFSMVLNTSLFMLISSLYWYSKQWQIEREQHLMAQNEKLQAELSFLRSQISPHFIFNTLNNIYTLALQKHDNTAPMVAKLATLLRYLLYEGSQGRILLQKEVTTLKQYIELQLLRKPRSQNVDFYVDGNMNGWHIAPMLLINFVENAFKFSHIDTDEHAWIKMNLQISETGGLIFEIENSIGSKEIKSQQGGIGLQNVRRQLELNYPENHLLTFEEDHAVFQVNLSIQLEKNE